MINAANDRRIITDVREVDYFTRTATGGEVCLFCGHVFEAGEWYDSLFTAVCLPCYELEFESEESS